MKILLADDHTLFRDALIQYLERAEPDMRITLAKDYHEAEKTLERDAFFSLIILDLRMPGMNGLKGLQTIREKHPELRVALMSGVAAPEDVQAAIEMGAVGYFPKTLSGKALLQAIQLVLSGEHFIPIDQRTNRVMPSHYADAPNAITSISVGGSRKEGKIKTLQDIKLTPRENEVLQYLMDGASNKDIAEDLGLQVVTVKLHVRGICRKFSAKNRTQAAMRAKELGFSKTRQGA